MLWQVGGVVNSVVELGSSSVGLVVYRREEGGRNSKYNANISMTMRDMTMSGARCALTRQQVVPAKGGNIRKSIPDVLRFRTNGPEGESCEFDMLGVCGGRMSCVSRFVSSF